MVGISVLDIFFSDFSLSGLRYQNDFSLKQHSKIGDSKVKIGFLEMCHS